jgi:hypothetical protein
MLMAATIAKILLPAQHIRNQQITSLVAQLKLEPTEMQ